MKKIFIISVLLLFTIACGKKTVELGNPDFPDNESAGDADTTDTDADTENDSDIDEIIADNDTTVDPDDDTIVDPDDDSTIIPDDDSTITPDEDTVTECTIGEQKCDATLDNVLECNVAHAWVSVEDCSDPLKMCVENPVGTFYCDTLICEPGVKFCKNEDVYTCNADGKTDVLSTNCTDLQYCDNAVDPVICSDMVCDPSETYCDVNILKECAANGGSSTTVKDCSSDSGVCDDTLNNCVYTGNTGGDTTNSNKTGKRGNFFDCTKNVKVVEFAQRFNFTGDKDLTWTIYEAEGNSTTYTRIFIKTSNVTGVGDSQYSTGSISVNLMNGKKYIFVTAWAGQISFYDNGANHPIDVGFGSSTNGFSSNTDLPEQLVNPSGFNFVYNQRIKFSDN